MASITRAFILRTLVTFILVILACQGKPLKPKKLPKGKDCIGNRKVDIMFVVDSSSSIWPPNFSKQIDFLKSVVEKFDVSREGTRVGMLTFSDIPHLQFHLNAYVTKQDVINAMSRVEQENGGTDTARAIHQVIHGFSARNGGRPHEATQIAIILTDGNSDRRDATARAAAKARHHNIHLFAIGIGNNIHDQELRQIANEPDKQYVFKVRDFDALSSIREVVTQTACGVNSDDSGPVVQKPTADPDSMVSCDPQEARDVVFAFSGAQTMQHNVRHFIRGVMDKFDIAPDRVQVSLVPKKCRQSMDGFDLQVHNTKGEVQKALETESDIDTSTLEGMVRFMRTKSFAGINGARNNVKKIGIIILDNNPRHLKAIAVEAERARVLGNIEMFVVGVGKAVSTSTLGTLASSPIDQHILHVSDYSELTRITIPLVNKL